jgi:UDP-N-acetylglucosamine--N-acetylmuramyl-(pentapeptide) pyrophosphoryl-undecaprenol N-acetylglucosamine transferase
LSNPHRKIPRILIAGGGTGGHVFPALAIKQAIAAKAPDARIIFAGTRRGFEASILPRNHETLKFIWISGFSRRHMLQNLLLPLKLVVSFAQSLGLMMSFRPHLVIGTGGYVMGPVLWTAQWIGVPTLLQEQNSYPGYTTRKLSRKATVVCAGFEEVKNRLSAKRVEVTGNPLRSTFRAADRESARNKWNLDSNRQTILIFGGSAGAKSINEAVAGSIAELTSAFNVLWQTGKSGVPTSADQQTMLHATQAKHLLILEFIEDMANAYAIADLAICRAGAMTLAELAVIGVPAILVPYPFATDDHQSANAKSVAEKGGAVCIKDSELSPTLLTSTVRDILESADKLSQMSDGMKSLARPDAATRIAEIALTIVEQA